MLIDVPTIVPDFSNGFSIVFKPVNWESDHFDSKPAENSLKICRQPEDEKREKKHLNAI